MSKFNSSKLLIVDDEEGLRSLLSQVLTKAGFQVTAAADGEEAWEIFQEDPVPLVIADIVMPGMNGIELMKQAREVVPELSTIIITAHATIRTAIAAMREGAHDYIEKPFCPERVELLISGLVEHQNLVEENITLRRRLEDRYRFGDVIAKSPKMLSILELIKKFF